MKFYNLLSLAAAVVVVSADPVPRKWLPSLTNQAPSSVLTLSPYSALDFMPIADK